MPLALAGSEPLPRSAGSRTIWLRLHSARVPSARVCIPEIGYAHEALVDGDARCASISAAAILAKTVRDRLMHRLAMRHPGYGWDTNVGYGTEEHQEGLRINGPTKHHRLTFAPLAQLTLSL